MAAVAIPRVDALRIDSHLRCCVLEVLVIPFAQSHTGSRASLVGLLRPERIGHYLTVPRSNSLRLTANRLQRAGNC